MSALGLLRPRGRVLPDHLVDAEGGRAVAAIHAVDTGHVRRTARLARVAEQQPDRPLADHRDPLAGDVDPVELVQHRAQRLHDRRLDVGQLVVELDDRVLAGDEVLGEALVALGPADDPRAGLGDPDHLVQRVAGLAQGIHERVAPPEERRQVRAADPAGSQPDEHASRPGLRDRRLHALQAPRRRDGVRPHAARVVPWGMRAALRIPLVPVAAGWAAAVTAVAGVGGLATCSARSPPTWPGRGSSSKANRRRPPVLEILLRLATIVALSQFVWPHNRAAALALAPYGAWTAFATALTWTIAASN